ncbi:BACON domain-containing protein [Alistipes sp.]|uniref:BACON domain-containing protein n=1 Tax=Alistipes sp. TaxID=1872444 RepID=UPI0025C27639|nr:BACON domain-containing protein [Alistipes sp.]
MIWALFAAVGCSDKTQEEVADVINLSKRSVAFATEGGSTDIAVACPSQWEAACADTWVTLQPGEAVLTIVAEENPAAATRETVVTVKSANDEKTIAVRQAFSDEPVLLATSVEEELSFDSEGESYTFRVETNGTWTATCDADWLTVTCNPESSTVQLIAAKNSDAHRTAEVTVSATRGDDTKSCPIAVAQISRDENPYYRFLGHYGLHAENWYYGGQLLGVSGTGTYCTVEEKEYRKSVYIKDLFTDGTVIEATYDKYTQQLTIPLGNICKTQEVSASVTRFYFPMTINMNESSFYSGTLTGTYGEGYNDIEEKMCPAIHLSGFHDEYPAFGLIGYQSQQYVHFVDLYYATGSMYFVRMDSGSETSGSGVTQAAARVTVPENKVVIMKR